MNRGKQSGAIAVRPFRERDAERAARLFRDTVFRVNRADYDEAQLRAWAAGADDVDAWAARFRAHRAFAAEKDVGLLGFGDIAEDGDLDRLFVHAEHQREGVGTALLEALERAVSAKTLRTEASLTARPFFLARGWHVVREQRAFCRGAQFVNFLMEKERT